MREKRKSMFALDVMPVNCSGTFCTRIDPGLEDRFDYLPWSGPGLPDSQ